MYNRHGMSDSSEYTSWEGMKRRCFNPNHKRYSDWGGRGITVCDRWKNSFENFFADMGLKPTSKHSIDRIDNDGDYCPDNCRWATKEQQVNNRKNNRLITIDGVTLNVKQWEKEKGFKTNVITKRLINGWDEIDAVLTPLNPSVMITMNEITLSVTQWEVKQGFKKGIIYRRLYKGWSGSDAITTPVRNR